MTALANVTISKVWRGKSGEGKYGPWQAYNFKVEGHEDKFGYFQSGSKPVPQEGMLLEVLQYETRQNGQYTNHDVKLMQVAQGQNTAPTPQTRPAQAVKPNGNGNGNTAWDKKSITIGLYACLKAASALPQDNEEDLFTSAVDLFKRVERFAEGYKPDPVRTAMDELLSKISKFGDPGIIHFISKSYKVDVLEKLSPAQLAHAVERWQGIVRAYNAACVAAEEAQRDHQDAPVGGEDEELLPWEEEAAPMPAPAPEPEF